MTTPKKLPSFEYFDEVVDHLHGLGHDELRYQESQLGQSHIIIRRIFLPSGKEMARVRIGEAGNKWLLFGDESTPPKALPAGALPITEEICKAAHFAPQGQSWTWLFRSQLEKVALEKVLLSASPEATQPRKRPRL